MIIIEMRDIIIMMMIYHDHHDDDDIMIIIIITTSSLHRLTVLTMLSLIFLICLTDLPVAITKYLNFANPGELYDDS
jgi:hypothetical protein